VRRSCRVGSGVEGSGDASASFLVSPVLCSSLDAYWGLGGTAPDLLSPSPAATGGKNDLATALPPTTVEMYLLAYRVIYYMVLM
jgi:hypothetical protein